MEQRKAKLVDSARGGVLAVYGAARRAEGASSIPSAPNPFAFLLRVRREAAGAPAKRKASEASLSRVGKGLQATFRVNERENPAAKRPARGPKGRACRVKAERSEAFTRHQVCKQWSGQRRVEVVGVRKKNQKKFRKNRQKIRKNRGK